MTISDSNLSVNSSFYQNSLPNSSICINPNTIRIRNGIK